MEKIRQVLFGTADEPVPPLIELKDFTGGGQRDYTPAVRARMWRDYYRAHYFRAVIRDTQRSVFKSMLEKLASLIQADAYAAAKEDHRGFWRTYQGTLAMNLLPGLRQQVANRSELSDQEKEAEASHLADELAQSMAEKAIEEEPSEDGLYLGLNRVLRLYSRDDALLETLAEDAVAELGCASLPHMWLVDLLVWEAGDFIFTAGLRPYRLGETTQPWRYDRPPPRPAFAQMMRLTPWQSDEELRTQFDELLSVVDASRDRRRGRPRWDGAEPSDEAQLTALYRKLRGSTTAQLKAYVPDLANLVSRTLERNLERLQALIFTTEPTDIGSHPVLDPIGPRQNWSSAGGILSPGYGPLRGPTITTL